MQISNEIIVQRLPVSSDSTLKPETSSQKKLSDLNLQSPYYDRGNVLTKLNQTSQALRNSETNQEPLEGPDVKRIPDNRSAKNDSRALSMKKSKQLSLDQLNLSD